MNRPSPQPSSLSATEITSGLEACWRETSDRFHTSPPMALLRSGGFGLAHYKAYLRQVFHHTREHPQLLSLAASRLRGSDRGLVGRLLQHALEEFGHDQWALKDLAALGEDVSAIPFENPLPETVALHAFAHFQITERNPVAHLGYLYFLELMPATCGPAYLEMLSQAGVPRAAMSFLAEHVKVDQDHTCALQDYAQVLIYDEADLEAVRFAMRATGRLYEAFLGAVIEQTQAPADWGPNGGEGSR